MGKRFATALACAFAAVLLCLGLMPATALAAAPSGQAIYVGEENVTSGGYWATDDSGNVTAYSGEGTPTDNYIHYDAADNTLTLHNATIKESVPSDTNTYVVGEAIGVFNQNGAAELTIALEGTNTIAEVSMGICVLASSESTGDASLTITGNGSLTTEGSGFGFFSGISVLSIAGNANLTINNVDVTATSNTQGIRLQPASTSPATLTVNGGSLTASGSKGIDYQFGTDTTGSGTPTVTVSNNAIVRANGGIANNSSTSIQYGTGNEENGGIVWDGKDGTVYGSVELQEDLEIGEGETLKLDDGASLSAGSHNVIVDGGTVDESLKTGLGDSVKYAPTITTTSLPNGTVGTSYNQTLAATGSDTITWSLESGGTLPAGLKLENGVISGSPTAAGTSTFTVTATNAYGSDSKQLSITIDAQTDVPVTGVSLNKTELTLTEGSSETLVASVTPPDATNQKVTWSSSAESVATVDANGNVTAVGAGTAVITVTTEDGSKAATCAVTVEHDPASEWSSDANGHWHECEACHDKLDYAAHTPKVKGAQGATCTEDGYTGDTVCSVCGYVIAKGKAIPAIGHDFVDGVCAVCGAEDPDYVAPKKPKSAGGQEEEPAIPATGDATTLFSAVPALAGATAVAAGAYLRRRR